MSSPAEPPARPADAPAAETPSRRAPAGRVLVVDDSHFARAFVIATMRRAGYEVTGAESAAEAERFLEGKKFDVAVTDIVMPGGDGISLLDRLKRRDPDMPVLMITGVGSLETALAAMRGGASDYLVKPLEPEALIAAVKRALENRDLRETVALYELSKAVVGTVRRDELVARLAETARVGLRCSVAATVFGDAVTGAPADALTPELAKLARSIVEAHGGEAVATAAAPEGCGHTTAAVVCIRGRRDSTAWLVLFRDGEPRDALFSPRDERMLRVLASVAQLAFDNAELYGELEVSLATIRETQTRLANAERLSAIGELAAGVAHELNNPMTGILGLAELLAADLAGSRHAEDLGTIRKSALRCRGIIQDLIAFARKRIVELDPVDVRFIIDQVVAIEGDNCEKRGIAVRVDIAEGIKRVNANALELRQVFGNIVANARDAVSGIGRPGRIEIRAFQPNQRVVRIEIADNGPGVPPGIRSRIFEPFFTTKDVGAGMGLGLAVTYGIVRRLGGWVEVQDAPGGGALFRIELPAA